MNVNEDNRQKTLPSPKNRQILAADSIQNRINYIAELTLTNWNY